ncbi:MAG: hypothetical protein JNJ40_17425 [Bacteroidia bacterium]|nr:hypothetical protein [Bacteroidia bacterium]
MKRSLTLLTILFLLIHSKVYFAQIPSTNSLIKKLDNRQFTILHTEKASFSMNSKPAIQLIKRGTSISQKLISALNDTTKTIMAHLVLCHIYFKVATFAGPKIVMQNDKEIFKYFLGQKDGEGLIISEMKEANTHKMYLEEKDRAAIITYWKDKTSKK